MKTPFDLELPGTHEEAIRWLDSEPPRAAYSHKEEGFGKIIYDCVENTFKEVLGEGSASVVFYHTGILGASVVDIEAFARTLERLFGSGARILERCVLERLYSQAGRVFKEKEEYRFIDYINELRRTVQ